MHAPNAVEESKLQLSEEDTKEAGDPQPLRSYRRGATCSSIFLDGPDREGQEDDRLPEGRGFVVRGEPG